MSQTNPNTSEMKVLAYEKSYVLDLFKPSEPPADMLTRLDQLEEEHRKEVSQLVQNQEKQASDGHFSNARRPKSIKSIIYLEESGQVPIGHLELSETEKLVSFSNSNSFAFLSPMKILESGSINSSVAHRKFNRANGSQMGRGGRRTRGNVHNGGHSDFHGSNRGGNNYRRTHQTEASYSHQKSSTRGSDYVPDEGPLDENCWDFPVTGKGSGFFGDDGTFHESGARAENVDTIHDQIQSGFPLSDLNSRPSSEFSNWKQRLRGEIQEERVLTELQSESAAVDSLFGPSHTLEPIDARQSAPSISWNYKDPQGLVQGPFSVLEMQQWLQAGYFPENLLVKSSIDEDFCELILYLGSLDNVRRQIPGGEMIEIFSVPIKAVAPGMPIPDSRETPQNISNQEANAPTSFTDSLDIEKEKSDTVTNVSATNKSGSSEKQTNVQAVIDSIMKLGVKESSAAQDRKPKSKKTQKSNAASKSTVKEPKNQNVTAKTSPIHDENPWNAISAVSIVKGTMNEDGTSNHESKSGRLNPASSTGAQHFLQAVRNKPMSLSSTSAASFTTAGGMSSIYNSNDSLHTAPSPMSQNSGNTSPKGAVQPSRNSAVTEWCLTKLEKLRGLIDISSFIEILSTLSEPKSIIEVVHDAIGSHIDVVDPQEFAAEFIKRKHAELKREGTPKIPPPPAGSVYLSKKAEQEDGFIQVKRKKRPNKRN